MKIGLRLGLRNLAKRLLRLDSDNVRRRIERSYPSISLVPSHLTEPEKLLLYRLSRKVPRQATIVEIGSYLGASTCFLAAGAHKKGGTVYAVDTWTNIGVSEEPRDTYDEFLRNIAPLNDTITPLRGLSVEVAKEFREPINLLFVDGAHSYDAVAADLRAWLPKLRDGGFVVLHDYGWAEAVKRSVEEFVRPIELSPGKVVGNTYWTRVRSPRSGRA